jgi:hypothetical protein
VRDAGHELAEGAQAAGLDELGLGVAEPLRGVAQLLARALELLTERAQLLGRHRVHSSPAHFRLRAAARA